jgi:hypothetical protein
VSSGSGSWELDCDDMMMNECNDTPTLAILVQCSFTLDCWLEGHCRAIKLKLNPTEEAWPLIE